MAKKETNIENPVIEQIVMDDETKQAVIEDNMHLVPKGQLKKFNELSLDEKMKKIEFYQDIQRIKEDARIRNSIKTKVSEMFEKRHGTIDDARDVLKFCNDFIDSYKLREIAKLDEQIAILEEQKMALNS